MKNLKHSIRKKRTSLSNFMRSTAPFSLFFALFALPIVADQAEESSRLEDLGKRLSLYPPSPDEFTPIEETVQNEMEALRQLNLDKAYYFFTSKAFKKATPFPIYTLFIKSNPVLLNNKSLTKTEIKMNGPVAYYEGVGIDKYGVSRKVKVQLVLEDEKWKIQGIQVE